MIPSAGSDRAPLLRATPGLRPPEALLVASDLFCDQLPATALAGPFPLNGRPLSFAKVVMELPDFDPEAPGDRTRVLVRKLAFSVNYRDRASILQRAERLGSGLAGEQVDWFGFGSDFVAEVLEPGADVLDLSAGDRVIPSGHYGPPDGSLGPVGLATETASLEVEVLDAARLFRIPETMPDVEAAGFTVGAVTSSAMVRRTGVKPGDRVLVTAGMSNTSLFVLARLRHAGAEVYVLTTSSGARDRLISLGARDVFVVDPLRGPGAVMDTLASIPAFEGFRIVIDPFFDLYLPWAVELLTFGGTYVTCGVVNQGGLHRAGTGGSPELLSRLGNLIVVKNLTLLGSCLGDRQDLQNALADHARGAFRVPLDSVWDGDGFGEFLERSFMAKNRFGKVIYQFERGSEEGREGETAERDGGV